MLIYRLAAHRNAVFARYENVREAVRQRYLDRIAQADPNVGHSSIGFLLAHNYGNPAAKAVLQRFKTISGWLYGRRRREDTLADHRDHVAENESPAYCSACHPLTQ
jgi:hypothetical protein